MQAILKDKKQQGFTLIEIAIVTMIVGILIGGFAPLYFQKVEQERYERTVEAVTSMSESLGDFRNLYGRYPCPARTDLSRDDAQYGREGDCSDTSVAAGSCSGGICAESSIRQVNIGTPGAPVMVTPRIRVGALPFRDMNIEEDEVYDGYGNPVSYSVTERLADNTVTFEETNGGIEILGDDGNTVLGTAGSAHFIIISHGKDGTGKFLPDGSRADCPSGTLEEENCDADTDAVYRAMQASKESGSDYFGDIVRYFTQSQVTEWRMRTPDELASADEIPPIHQIDLGDNVIIDGTAATAPVAGTDIVEGTLRTSEDLMTQNVCEMNGSNDCFSSSLIAGAAPTGGLTCPSGKFMTGIQHGAPVCEEEIFAICPDGHALVGFESDGKLKCIAPPTYCPDTTISICPNTTQFLPKSANGKMVTVTAGDSRSMTYYCNKTYWSLYTYSGVCTCVMPNPSTILATSPCGLGYTGTMQYERQYQCPQGIWTNVPGGYWTQPAVIAQYCTCNPVEDKKEFTCGNAGYPVTYEGKVVKARYNTCPANTWSCGNSGNWPGCTVLSDTCACPTGKTETRQINCKTGYTSSGGNKIWETRALDCPSGNWGPWTEISNDCICTPKTETREASCPAGKVGSKIEERVFTCTVDSGTWGAWTVKEDNCVDAPQIVCKWTASVTGEPGVSGIGEELGYTCDTCGATGNCHMRIGPNNYYNYSVCTCQ